MRRPHRGGKNIRHPTCRLRGLPFQEAGADRLDRSSAASALMSVRTAPGYPGPAGVPLEAAGRRAQAGGVLRAQADGVLRIAAPDGSRRTDTGGRIPARSSCVAARSLDRSVRRNRAHRRRLDLYNHDHSRHRPHKRPGPSNPSPQTTYPTWLASVPALCSAGTVACTRRGLDTRLLRSDCGTRAGPEIQARGAHQQHPMSVEVPEEAVRKTCRTLPCRRPSGAPCWTRTSDPQLRRLLLYPPELRARKEAAVAVSASSSPTGRT
jgi:hypothetical protein